MAENLLHYPKVKGFSTTVATSTGIEKMVKSSDHPMTSTTFKVLLLGQGGSLMVEHLTRHPKVKSSSLAAATGTDIEKRSNYVIFL